MPKSDQYGWQYLTEALRLSDTSKLQLASVATTVPMTAIPSEFHDHHTSAPPVAIANAATAAFLCAAAPPHVRRRRRPHSSPPE